MSCHRIVVNDIYVYMVYPALTRQIKNDHPDNRTLFSDLKSQKNYIYADCLPVALDIC